MDNTVITPAAGQAVITSTDHEHHGHHRGHHDDKHLEELIAREQAAFGRQEAENAAKGVVATKDARYDIVHEVDRAAAAGALADCKIGDEICSSTQDIRKDICELQKQISDSATATLVGFKDLTALSYQVEGRGLLEAAKNAAAITVQNDKLWYQTNLQAATNAAAATLLATQNQAAVLAAQAECCCELKEIAAANQAAVLARVNEIESNRIRDELRDCKSTLAAYYAAKVPPVVPLSG